MPSLKSDSGGSQAATSASTLAGPCVSNRKFEEPARLLPIAFVSFTIFCLWFIYVFSHCVPMLQMYVPDDEIDEGMKSRAFWELVWFHYITGMLLFCYVQCVFVLPGQIPADDPHWGVDARSPRAPLNLQETKKTGDRRHCKWCNKYKPDRCHHCRVCKTCILKMDHHCPWIYNCVGFANYKYFFLLLVYATLACLTIVVTMVESLLDVIDDEEHFFHMFCILWGETLAFFMLVLLAMFLSFHVCLILWAMTTIEFCEKKLPKNGEVRNLDSSVYAVGWYGNIAAVLGPNPFLWFFPCGLPKGDGMNFVSDESRLTKDIESGRGTRRMTHQRAQRNQRPIASESRSTLLSSTDMQGSGTYPQPGATPRM